MTIKNDAIPIGRSWISRWGIWPRLALAISLGFVLLFAAVMIIGERALQDSANRILDERLALTHMTANRMDSLFQEAIRELEQAQQLADFEPDDPDLADEADILSHTLGQVSLFAAGTAFFSSSGEALLSSPPTLYVSGDNLSSLPDFSRALARHEVVVSEPFLDPIQKQPVTAVIVPIQKNGRFLGLLIGLVKLDSPQIMGALNDAARIGSTGHATLVDQQGRTLAATLDIPFQTFSEHPDFYPQAMADGVPATGTTPFELANIAGERQGENHVMALVPLSTANWGVAVGGDEDETLIGVWRLRQGIILISSISLIIVWIITLLGTRALVRPIQQLKQAAQEIDSGNLGITLYAPSWGEFGEMVTALENMRLKLLSNIQELANWNETLGIRVAEQTKEIKILLRRTLAAQETERSRIARELHDEVGQMLTAIEFSLERLHLALPGSEAKAHERLEQSQVLTGKTVTDLRRIVAALRPGVLDELGLESALQWMHTHILQPTNITVSIASDRFPQRLPGLVETILFRIAQEAVNNVVHHSQATHLTIQLFQDERELVMTLIDNGKGFIPSEVSPDPEHNRGFGLVGMKERALMVNGRVTVDSHPGQGTTIRVTIPAVVVAECHDCPHGREYSEECEVCLVSPNRFG